eukprot:gene1672-1696_t
MPLDLVQKRGQFAVDHCLPRWIGAMLRIKIERDGRGQQVPITRYGGDEIARLHIGRHAQIVDVHRAHLQSGCACRIERAGKSRIAHRSATAGSKIDEIGTMAARPGGLQRGPFHRTIAGIKPQPLHRIARAIGRPVNRPIPPGQRRKRQHDRQGRNQQPAFWPQYCQNHVSPGSVTRQSAPACAGHRMGAYRMGA